MVAASWFESLALPGLLLVLTTATGLYLLENPIWSIALLAMQAVGVFILVGLEWPLALAVSILLAGWVSAAILWHAVYLHQQEGAGVLRFGGVSLSYGSTSAALIFRLLAVILVGLASISSLPAIADWAPGLATEPGIAAVFLVGLGLFQLGLTQHPMRVVIGLITILWGFCLVYAGVESSALVAGLLALVTMGLALLGVYFIFQGGMEEG